MIQCKSTALLWHGLLRLSMSPMQISAANILVCFQYEVVLVISEA